MNSWILFLIIIFGAVFVEISPAGLDAELYLGLGNNLLNGIGFIDTIRNDEILPTIGHPLVIMQALKYGISGEVLTISLVYTSLLLLFEVLKNFNVHPIITLLILVLSLASLPTLNVWGIEAMLIFSNVFLFYSFTLLIKSQALTRVIFFVFALLIAILVRPILLPFVYLMIPFLALCIFKKKCLRKNIVIGLAILISSLVSISTLSQVNYGDNRYLSGTYSSIPLYCAWNRYINLESTYYSSRWQEVPDEIKLEALEPLVNRSGWQERDKILKEKAVAFVFEKPMKALRGYLWRVSKYSYAADNILYRLFFFLWIFIVVVNFLYFKKQCAKGKVVFFFSLAVPIYIILVSSMFVYAGSRYLVTPSLHITFSIILLLYLLKNVSQTNQKIFYLNRGEPLWRLVK